MSRYTTPLDREILAHYYVCGYEFPRSSREIRRLQERFVEAGLLDRNQLNGTYEGNHEALEVYMEALAAVPLPCKTVIWTCEPQE